MHPTIRRRPLFALFVGFALITLSVLLNACQPSEGHMSSSLIIATVRPRAAPLSRVGFFEGGHGVARPLICGIL
jgi:hypothetical protein